MSLELYYNERMKIIRAILLAFTVVFVALPVQAQTRTVVVNTGKLNLRAGPAITHIVLAELPQGETLTVNDQSGVWLKVTRSNGQVGWINGFYTKEVRARATVTPSTALTPPPSNKQICRSGNVLANVHTPQRLRVINRCLTVSGIVTEISRSDDGDLTFRLQVDSAYTWIINSYNRSLIRGYLQVEIIPADQATVPAPTLGAHLSVTGAYVIDTPYGWSEIHPVWNIVKLP